MTDRTIREMLDELDRRGDDWSLPQRAHRHAVRTKFFPVLVAMLEGGTADQIDAALGALRVELEKVLTEPYAVLKTQVISMQQEATFDVDIRSGKWGTPFVVGSDGIDTCEEAVVLYREWITSGEGTYLLRDLSELVGKRLGCICKKPAPCHGDVLVELIAQADVLFMPD